MQEVEAEVAILPVVVAVEVHGTLVLFLIPRVQAEEAVLEPITQMNVLVMTLNTVEQVVGVEDTGRVGHLMEEAALLGAVAVAVGVEQSATLRMFRAGVEEKAGSIQVEAVALPEEVQVQTEMTLLLAQLAAGEVEAEEITLVQAEEAETEEHQEEVLAEAAPEALLEATVATVAVER